MLEFYPLCDRELVNISKQEDHTMKLVWGQLFWVVEGWIGELCRKCYYVGLELEDYFIHEL